MAFSDVLILFEYWADCPPVHLLVRGYLGYEGKKKTQTPTNFEHQSLAGMPGYNLAGLPDWQRTALERELNKMKGK